MSARTVFTPGQMFRLCPAQRALLAGFAFAPIATLIALNVAMGMFYLGNFVFKGILVSVGGGRSADMRRDHRDRGARAARGRTAGLHRSRSDVPRGGDAAAAGAGLARRSTIRSASSTSRSCSRRRYRDHRGRARRSGSKACSKSSSCRRREPQTKPKACNFALRFARGEYLVIYDAEDRPEPDQLRKVVATFRRSPPNTACLQCRLNYYNASENWLTRMFTLDYALWFDQVLPGLERLNMPIPLGGTSNHFRTDVLRELHAWDPFNVTEDADLGIRIGQKGYRVGVVDSTTFEEASCQTAQLDPPAFALDQGLHADAAGPHAAAVASIRARRSARLSRLRVLHRRHRAVRPAQSDRSGRSIWSGSWHAVGSFDTMFPQISAVPEPVQSARRQRRLHLSDHARADPARLARSHSL